MTLERLMRSFSVHAAIYSLWAASVTMPVAGVVDADTFTPKLRSAKHQDLHRKLQKNDNQELQCSCSDKDALDDAAAEMTIRLVSPGGEGNFFDYNARRYASRAEAYYEKTGIKVDIVNVNDLDEVNAEIIADAGKHVYDGYTFIPFVLGDITEAGALADITNHVAGSADVAWTDIFPFNREVQATYNDKVLTVPCDGDIISMFYRKDLFEQHGLLPPRTWDEYTERAKFFHGMEVPAADGNGTTVMDGSCVERTQQCGILRNYFFMQVHAATAQSQGTSGGLLFDSETLEPNLGEGFAETLRHLENHAMYGAERELDDVGCSNINLDDLHGGTCAMTFYWGDGFSRHLYEGSKIAGKLGVAPTPGVTRVLDHETQTLVDCTEETCPYGVTYPDIGRVNHGPFAAAGGWSAGVAAGLSKAREKAMADFISFVCGKEESFKDVITHVSNSTLSTGADPFRKSHFNVDEWVERGYPADTTELYLNTITEQFNSPNIVLDARFPGSGPMIVAMGNLVYSHLVASKSKIMTHEDRLAVVNQIEQDWKTRIADFNKKRPVHQQFTAQYQKSLNLYKEPTANDGSDNVSTALIIGLVVGCSIVVGLITGILIFVHSQRKLAEHIRLSEEAAERRRLAREDDDDSDCSVAEVDKRDETNEILKLSRKETRQVIVWRWILACVFVTTATIGCLYSYRAIKGDTIKVSAAGFSSILSALFVALASCFSIYDRSNRKRTDVIVANAARANAIVTQMFPGQFRDQLIQDQEAEEEAQKRTKRNASGSTMKALLDKDHGQLAGTKPLADLFLDTTVLFADIVGFTPWSSAREPTQVFTLLETLYSAFDAIAARRGVFKVETVGDCYVAVTGVPEYRRDHVTVMARFASDLLVEMSKLTKKLEVSLGPDTADLTLRIGMHSGPVTAGVLRGERSRFQLFGDTMNTTARIESTGLPNRIHVSQVAADMLIANGKTNWLEKRETKVVAKGKGSIQTYWVQVRSGRNSVAGSSLGDSSDRSHNSPEDFHSRTERLIRWNLDQLVGLLKQVVSRREAEKAANRRAMTPAGNCKIVEEGASLLDDVKEIVHLPEYDGEVVSHQAPPDDVFIPDEVLNQMHDYITAVSGMYHPNAFHNFEHASAVTMSVLKLLSRIVAPTTGSTFDNNSTSADASSLHDHTYGITSDPLTQFACAFSALIHDADHPGVPNAQLVKEHAAVALAYSDRSVAEQNSLVLCWDMLMQDEYKDFCKLLCASQNELDRFRSLVVNSVLATDIVDKDLKTLRNVRWDRAFQGASAEEPAIDAINRKATIVIEHLIQASDVSHTMQHWHIYRKWNERFFRECYAAYKAGRAPTDPSENWYKGEIGFFDFYIIPLAKKLKDCGVFGKSSGEFLNYAEQNRAEWEARGKEVVAEMIEAVKADEPLPLADDVFEEGV